MSQSPAPGPQPGPAPALRLPALAVRTDLADVETFRAETGGAAHAVPFTFPMRWLAAPEIAAALGAALAPDSVLVHESQSFAYERPLAVDRAYVLEIEAEQGRAPPRLTLRGQVTCEGALCLRLETVLRIVPAPAAAMP